MSPAPVEHRSSSSRLIATHDFDGTLLNSRRADLLRTLEGSRGNALSSEVEFRSTILPSSSAPPARTMSIPPVDRQQQSAEDDEDDSDTYDDMPELVPVSVSSWYEEEDDLPQPNHTWGSDPLAQHIFSNVRSMTMLDPPLLSRTHLTTSVETPSGLGNQNRATLADRIRNVSTEYVAPWLANLETLQNRYLRDLPANRSDPTYTQDRQRALSELNRALAETEALTSRITSLANELQTSIGNTWSARQGVDSPCVYVGEVPVLQRRNNVSTGETAEEVIDYDKLLREGKVDANGCEKAKRVLVEADR